MLVGGLSCLLRVGAAQAVAQENEAWAVWGTGVVFIANGSRGSTAAQTCLKSGGITKEFYRHASYSLIFITLNEFRSGRCSQMIGNIYNNNSCLF